MPKLRDFAVRATETYPGSVAASFGALANHESEVRARPPSAAGRVRMVVCASLRAQTHLARSYTHAVRLVLHDPEEGVITHGVLSLGSLGVPLATLPLTLEYQPRTHLVAPPFRSAAIRHVVAFKFKPGAPVAELINGYAVRRSRTLMAFRAALVLTAWPALSGPHGFDP
eukprot:1764972-Prymnesium_polylepis.1